jgi:adenine phosphoribosyltransferase
MNLIDYLPGIPDFPKPGILFRDISPLLGNSQAFHYAIEQMAQLAKDWEYTHILGIESRGFIFAAALAHHEHKSLVLVRKPGKLPLVTHKAFYGLEYGTDSLELQASSLPIGSRVIIVDDVLATGGTILAAASLVNQVGSEVFGALCLLEIQGLGGQIQLEKKQIPSKFILSL